MAFLSHPPTYVFYTASVRSPSAPASSLTISRDQSSRASLHFRNRGTSRNVKSENTIARTLYLAFDIALKLHRGDDAFGGSSLTATTTLIKSKTKDVGASRKLPTFEMRLMTSIQVLHERHFTQLRRAKTCLGYK